MNARRAEAELFFRLSGEHVRRQQKDAGQPGRTGVHMQKPQHTQNQHGGHAHMHAADSEYMHAAAFQKLRHRFRPRVRLVPKHGGNHHLPGLIIRRGALPEQGGSPFPEPQGKSPETAAPVSRPVPAILIQPDSGDDAVQVPPPLPVKDAGTARHLKRIRLSPDPVAFPCLQRAGPVTGGNHVQPPGTIRAKQHGFSGNSLNGAFHNHDSPRFHGNACVFPFIREKIYGGPHRQGNGKHPHGGRT